MSSNRDSICQLSVEKKSNIQWFLILSHQETNYAKNGLVFDEIEPYFSRISGQKLVFNGVEECFRSFLLSEHSSKVT